MAATLGRDESAWARVSLGQFRNEPPAEADRQSTVPTTVGSTGRAAAIRLLVRRRAAFDRTVWSPHRRLSRS
ncbi:hypothetical protein MRX96_048232 [Rhipicephalus microplus]